MSNEVRKLLKSIIAELFSWKLGCDYQESTEEAIAALERIDMERVGGALKAALEPHLRRRGKNSILPFVIDKLSKKLWPEGAPAPIAKKQNEGTAPEESATEEQGQLKIAKVGDIVKTSSGKWKAQFDQKRAEVVKVLKNKTTVKILLGSAKGRKKDFLHGALTIEEAPGVAAGARRASAEALFGNLKF